MNEREPRAKLSGHLRGPRHGIAAVGAQINRAKNVADGEFTRWRFFQVGSRPNRAIAVVQHFRRHRAQQKAVQHPMAMRGHHDQIHFFVASCLRDFAGRVASEQQAFDGNPVELRPQRLVQFFLGPLDDFRMQIPRRELVPALQHTGGIAQRRHHMQQYDLGMEMASQERGLMNHPRRGVWKVNWKKNLIHTHERFLSCIVCG